MPVPKRNPNESRKDFVSRCMNDKTMKSEYPDIDQRYAVCINESKNS